MFSGVVVGILAALSVATWAYSSSMRRTGGNNKSSITVGVVFGLIAFGVVVTIVATIDSMLGT